MRIFILLIFIFLFSCGSKTENTPNKTSKPKWIYGAFEEKNAICGVGVSLPHIKGKAYQRATAIARAIDEIARQMKVKVDTKIEHFLKGSSSGRHSRISSFSVQTTTGQTVRAKIKDIYFNEETSELYVLMCTF